MPNDIFSSESPFLDPELNNSCNIPSSSPSTDTLIYGINCPPSGCAGSIAPSEYTFLNCYIAGLSGKLGVGGEESSVTIELIDPVAKNCDSYPPSGCPIPSTDIGSYNGCIGSLYTIQLGGFSFRGILSYHTYQEGPDGFKYSVTLSDGKQVLNNVSVIVGGYYHKNTELGPNLINAVALSNASVANDLQCSSSTGNLCQQFGNGGVNQKGMYAYAAIEAINQQKCKVPVSGLCLNIDLSALITLIYDNKFNMEARLSSNYMTALEIIDYACNESGYVFFTQIIGDSIVVVPVSQKVEDNVDNGLFDFMNTLSASNIVIDRDYGQELTYNKSQRLVLGDNYRYMLQIDNSKFLCDTNNSCGSTYEPIPVPDCYGLYFPGAYAYVRTKHDFFSGGGTITGEGGCSAPDPWSPWNPVT